MITPDPIIMKGESFNINVSATISINEEIGKVGPVEVRFIGCFCLQSWPRGGKMYRLFCLQSWPRGGKIYRLFLFLIIY